MNRRLPALLMLIGGVIACNPSSTTPPPRETPPPSETAPPATPSGDRGPAQTNHAIGVSTSTNLGSANNPSIVTYVSQSGKDTVSWSCPAGQGSLSISGLATTNGPYAPSCPSSISCVSGNYTGTWPDGTPLDYQIRVGTYGPIYGRIIIKP